MATIELAGMHTWLAGTANEAARSVGLATLETFKAGPAQVSRLMSGARLLTWCETTECCAYFAETRRRPLAMYPTARRRPVTGPEREPLPTEKLRKIPWTYQDKACTVCWSQPGILLCAR